MISTEFPLRFSPAVDDETADYLEFEDVPGGQRLTWSEIGESLFVPAHEWSVPLSEVEAKNGGRFKIYGSTGFGLGRYHEFIVDSGSSIMWGSEPTFFRARLGATAQLSFGVATPLMAYLLDGYRDKYTGSWSEIATLRLVGIDASDVEAALISAFRAHFEHTGFWPRIQQLEHWWSDEEDEVGQGPAEAAPPQRLHLDIEPLRFLHSAMLQQDSTAACVYLYRVIEFYAFFATAQQMSVLRHDRAVSDADFSRKILEIVFRDEKGPLHKTVNTIVDQALLNKAVAHEVTTTPAAAQLTDALYAFRNSIVHGKVGSGFAMHSSPVLETEPFAWKWRPILLDLAIRAIDHYGSRG